MGYGRINVGGGGGGTELNIFPQLTQPTEKYGLWAKTNKPVDKVELLTEIKTGDTFKVDTSIPDFPVAVSPYCATYCPNTNTIIMAGVTDVTGSSARDTYSYDPKANTITKKTDSPLSSYTKSEIYHKGGIYRRAGSSLNSTSFSRYDPVSDTWRLLRDISLDYFPYAITAISDEEIAIFYDNFRPYIYNIPANTSWGMTSLSKLPYSLVVGEIKGNSEYDKIYLTVLGEVFKVDFKTATHTSLVSKLSTEQKYQKAFVIGDMLFQVGGYSFGELISTTRVYDKKTNTVYESSSRLPEPRRDSGCCSIGKVGYIFGGTKNNSSTGTQKTSYKLLFETDIFPKNTLVVDKGNYPTNKTKKAVLINDDEVMLEETVNNVYHSDGNAMTEVPFATSTNNNWR